MIDRLIKQKCSYIYIILFIRIEMFKEAKDDDKRITIKVSS